MNKNAIFAAAVIAGCTFSSCKKDVENDLYSQGDWTFDKSKRVEGTWDITSLMIDNEEFLVPDQGFEFSINLIFDADGDFQQNVIIAGEFYGYSFEYTLPFTGTWTRDMQNLDMDFDEDSQGAQYLEASPINYFTGNYYTYTESYEIIEINGDKVHLRTESNGQVVEIRGSRQ